MSQDEHKLSVFPAFFKVRGRPVLIVGSGVEALAKIRLVAETSACVVAIAPDPEPQLYAYLKKITESGSFVKWLDAPFDKAMLEGAVLVFAATGDFRQDRAVAEAARDACIPLNVVDRPELCDFFTPALVNRAPVAVAIGSEGTGPVLAQLIRLRIETLLGSEVGQLARFAGRFREKVEAHIAKGSARRRFWRAFFSGAVAQAIFRGDEAAAGKEALKLLASDRTVNQPICFVYVGHGKADWLTLGSQRALMEADSIVYDDDVATDILGMARRDAGLFSVSSLSPVSTKLARKLCQKGGQVLRLVTNEARLAEEVALLGAYDAGFEILPSLSSGPVMVKDIAYPCRTQHLPAMLYRADRQNGEGAVKSR